MSRVNWIFRATAFAILVILLYPPADFVSPATEGDQVMALKHAGSPETRINRGFLFISEVGGMTQIRYTQWFTEFAVVLLAGAMLSKAWPSGQQQKK